MPNFAVERIITEYWVIQEKGYTPHANDTITVMCIAYANKVDAKENDHSKKIAQHEHTFNIQGNEKINEAQYIDDLLSTMQGSTKVNL